MVSTIDNSINFLNQFKIETISPSTSIEVITDLSYDNSLKLVRIEDQNYFVLEIDKISNERTYNKFFSVLLNKIVLTNSQCKIDAFRRIKNNPCFYFKKNEGDLLLKEYLEDEGYNFEERVNICKKLVILIHELFTEMKKNDERANFFGISIDSFIYNVHSKTLKIIHFGFETALIEAGYPVDELKKRVLNYCPKEILMSVFAKIHGEKLSVYIVGSILLEILCGKVPWGERNYDAVKNFLNVGSETVFQSVELEYEEMIKNSLSGTSDSEKDLISSEIKKIIELSTEPEVEKRNLTLFELKSHVLKLLSEAELIGCDLCEKVKEKAVFYRNLNSKFYCEICKKQENSSEGDFISIDEFRISKYDKQLESSFKLVNQLSSKNFSDINNEIKRVKDEMTNNKIKQIEKIDEDLERYIEEIQRFKKKLKEDSLKRLEIENQFYDNILLINKNTERYKTELTNKYSETLSKIKEKDNQVEKDYKLLRENYFSAKEIETKLTKFNNEVFNNFYGGYEAIYILYKDINNHFSDFISQIGNYFENTFSKSLNNFYKGFEVNHNTNLDKCVENYEFYVKDQKDQDPEDDDKNIDFHKDIFGLIISADQISLNEEEVRLNISKRNNCD